MGIVDPVNKPHQIYGNAGSPQKHENIRDSRHDDILPKTFVRFDYNSNKSSCQEENRTNFRKMLETIDLCRILYYNTKKTTICRGKLT